MCMDVVLKGNKPIRFGSELTDGEFLAKYQQMAAQMRSQEEIK